MSSVRIIIDDHPRGKKGEIVSVPFGVGKQMIAAGLAEYPLAKSALAAPAVATATPPAERHAAEIARLNAAHTKAMDDVKAEAIEEMKRLQKEHDNEARKLHADLDAAHKQITDLQAQAKAQAKK